MGESLNIKVGGEDKIKYINKVIIIVRTKKIMYYYYDVQQ